MDRVRHLRIYDLHSWTGVALGLFLYVVAFTGCFALFHSEIHTWEDPGQRLTLAENPVPIDATFRQWVEETADGGKIEFVRFDNPSVYTPYYGGFVSVRDEAGEVHFHDQRWNASDGTPLEHRDHGLSTWLLDFHRDLMWPDFLGGRIAGRSIVGIAGIAMMLLIVTGVVAHTKIREELFTLRFFRSVRLKWQDAHKVFGLWGLPFHSMIAVTGAWLGVVALLAPLVAMLAFKGDQEALFAVLTNEEEPAGVHAEVLSIDTLRTFSYGHGLQAEDARATGRANETAVATDSRRPAFISFRHWGDANARADMFYIADTELMIYEGYRIDAVTGARAEGGFLDSRTAGTRVGGAFSALHYGTYGGIALKFLYFVLGGALAIISALGMMMWVERRLYGNVGKRSARVYRAVSRLTVGAVAGPPLATAAIFWLDKLYGGAESARMVWTGSAYFAVWFAAIGYGFARRDDYLAARELLLATGALFVGAPFVNAVMTGDPFWLLAGASHRIAGYVDIALLMLGALTIFAALRLPQKRSEAKKGRRGEAGEAVKDAVAETPAPQGLPAE